MNPYTRANNEIIYLTNNFYLIDNKLLKIAVKRG